MQAAACDAAASASTARPLSTSRLEVLLDAEGALPPEGTALLALAGPASALALLSATLPCWLLPASDVDASHANLKLVHLLHANQDGGVPDLVLQVHTRKVSILKLQPRYAWGAA